MKWNKEQFYKLINPEDKVICKCGHRIRFFSGRDRIICNFCGNYVYKNKKSEFKYKLKEWRNKNGR